MEEQDARRLPAHVMVDGDDVHAALPERAQHRLQLLLGDGEGGFKPATTSPVELGNRAWGIVARDLNGDGHIDLAAAGENAVAVLIGDGHSAFKRVKGSPFRTGKGSWRLA